MRVIKSIVAPNACLNVEIDLKEFSPQACLTDAYRSDVLADLNWDNHVFQRHLRYETIATVIDVNGVQTCITYVWLPEAHR